MIFGFLIVLIGAIFLLENLGFITIDTWEVIWPVALILIGVSIILKSFSKDYYTIKGKKEEKQDKE